MITAAALAIGDELLSGRTRDENVGHLAAWLTARGISLREARIVADDVAAIAAALNDLRAAHRYVFTSGGIGPTHDDMTVDAVAAAFGVDVVVDRRAMALLRGWYEAKGEEVTPARARMARLPDGAALVENPVSGAPGARIDNVFILAGVPKIFRAMLDAVDADLERGDVIASRAVTAAGLPESRLADDLRRIQEGAGGVAIGSYPIDGDAKGVTVIARAVDAGAADAAIDAVSDAMRALGAEPVAGDHRTARD